MLGTGASHQARVEAWYRRLDVMQRSLCRHGGLQFRDLKQCLPAQGLIPATSARATVTPVRGPTPATPSKEAQAAMAVTRPMGMQKSPAGHNTIMSATVIPQRP